MSPPRAAVPAGQAVTAGSLGRLDAPERERYAADGYLVRTGVFEPAELQAIVADCEELVARLVARRRHGRRAFGSYTFERDRELDAIVKWEGDSDVVSGVEPFAHLSPTLAAWAHDARFLEPMRDICGDDAPCLYTEKLNLKRPRRGGANPLHQDQPYWREIADDLERIATAMVFLDEAAVENGCLEVLPGSHRLGVQATRAERDGSNNLEMDPAPFEGVELTPLPVPAGAVVFFGPLLVHRSEPNRSDRQRRSLLLSYQPAGCRHLRERLFAPRDPAPPGNDG
jgi:Phytanoyl-CoA dioxygenase (PhyH)